MPELKRRFRPREQCQGKRPHETKGSAIGEINYLVEKRGANGRQLRAYRCRHCPGWHVGHIPGSKQKTR